jgi:transposase
VSVEHAALDPFRGYRNAIRDELPEAVAVLDAFHVVRSARCRVERPTPRWAAMAVTDSPRAWRAWAMSSCRR